MIPDLRCRGALLAALILLGCSGSGTAPEPAPAASGPETAAPTPAEGAPAAPAEPPPPAGGSVAAPPPEEPAAAEPPPLASARAACERGWEHFGAGRLDEAARELAVGRDALVELALADAEARRVLGACEYNRGRVLEAQGRRNEARSAYERSLLHRANETVLARWRTLAEAGAAPPGTAPASLFSTVVAERRRVCRGEPEMVASPGRTAALRPTCGVGILDVALDGADRGVAVLERFSGYDPEVGDTSIQWSFPLFALSGGRWREVRALFAPGGDRLDGYEVDVELRELTGAPPAEMVARVEYAVSYVPSADDGGATYEGMVVCGRLETPTPACAELPTGGSDSEGEDDGPSSSEIELAPGGRVIITDHVDGDEGDEVSRRETTLEALWGPARSAP